MLQRGGKKHRNKAPAPRRLTFGPFDEFDFGDFLGSWFSTQHIEADDSTCLFESLHSLTVRHLPHVHIVDKQDAVVHAVEKRSTVSDADQPSPQQTLDVHVPPAGVEGSTNITLCSEPVFTVRNISDSANRKWDSLGRFSPQPSILGGGSSGDDFGDEDAGVVAHVGVVSSSRYAEAKA